MESTDTKSKWDDILDAFAGVINTLSACIEKTFGGKFLFAIAAAYGLVYIIENGSQTDPIVASLITLIVKSYFDKDNSAVALMKDDLLKKV